MVLPTPPKGKVRDLASDNFTEKRRPESPGRGPIKIIKKRVNYITAGLRGRVTIQTVFYKTHAGAFIAWVYFYIYRPVMYILFYHL